MVKSRHKVCNYTGNRYFQITNTGQLWEVGLLDGSTKLFETIHSNLCFPVSWSLHHFLRQGRDRASKLLAFHTFFHLSSNALKECLSTLLNPTGHDTIE